MDPLTARAPDVTRVWLETWEWECCGEPFGIGDEVDLLLLTRTPSTSFVESMGLELAATIDAIESHHQETQTIPEDRVRGRVRGIHAVVQEHLETRHLRRPGFGAPADAEMPAEGEEWPFTGRDLGNGFMAGSRPTKWMIESVPVPGAVTLAAQSSTSLLLTFTAAQGGLGAVLPRQHAHRQGHHAFCSGRHPRSPRTLAP